MPASEPAGLPARITAVRTSVGLGQRAFAARVGVTRNMVIRWEGGHDRPRVQTLERIAAAGGVSEVWLLRGNGRPPRRPEPTLAEAVALLRAAWGKPGRRARILKVLGGLGTAVMLVGVLLASPAPVAADPLGPPEAAQLAARILEGRVWLVHAVVVRVIDGDTVVPNLDLGWHTWRHNESVRIAHIDAPERADKARWSEAKAFVERLLPAGTEVLLISEKLEKYGRTLGRIVLRDGRDVGVELLKAGLAVPYEGGTKGEAPRAIQK